MELIDPTKFTCGLNLTVRVYLEPLGERDGWRVSVSDVLEDVNDPNNIVEVRAESVISALSIERQDARAREQQIELFRAHIKNALLSFCEHEIDEQLKYDGVQIHNPHEGE